MILLCRIFKHLDHKELYILEQKAFGMVLYFAALYWISQMLDNLKIGDYSKYVLMTVNRSGQEDANK